MRPRRVPTVPTTTRSASLNVPRSSTSRSRVRRTEEMSLPTEDNVRERDRSSDRDRPNLADEHRERPRPIDDHLAAWLAEYGHLPGPSTAPARRDDRPAGAVAGQPDAQFVLRLSAQKL